MDLNWLVERVYNERDPGRGIATSAAGTTGLTTYLYWEDWVVAGFVTIIVFPIGRILASAIHSHWNQSRERNRSMDQLKDLFDTSASNSTHGHLRGARQGRCLCGSDRAATRDASLRRTHLPLSIRPIVPA